jgi:hypothetical protein
MKKDDQELVKKEKRRRGECFNCCKNGPLARDCWSPWRHSEGNMATMKEISLSTCPSEEEWDVEVVTTFEDDGANFVEALTEGETPSNSIEEEEEWDAEGGFSTKIRDQDTSDGFIVCDSNEDWKALSDEREYIKDEKIEPSLHEDDAPQEHNKDEDGTLMIHEDLEERDKEKSLPEGCRCEDSRYVNASPSIILLSSYKEQSI